MTYPQQPGRQPGPYGMPQQSARQPQAPQPGRPPQGYGPPQPSPPQPGYPQPGQPYGSMPTGQPPQPTPPKKKTGLWIGLGAAVVVLATFAVTAFLAPGFLLSDDDTDSDRTADGGGDSSLDFGDSEAAAAAEKVAQGWADGDYEGLKALICPGSEAALHGYATDAPLVTDFEVTSDLRESQNPVSASFSARVSLEHEGQTASVEPTFTVAKPSGTWCWSSIDGI